MNLCSFIAIIRYMSFLLTLESKSVYYLVFILLDDIFDIFFLYFVNFTFILFIIISINSNFHFSVISSGNSLFVFHL